MLWSVGPRVIPYGTLVVIISMVKGRLGISACCDLSGNSLPVVYLYKSSLSKF